MSTNTKSATPLLGQQAAEIQPFGHFVRLPIALSETVCRESIENLNQLLADTATLRDLYKKHHWQVLGPTFYQLHLLFDKHSGEQGVFVDSISAEDVEHVFGIRVKSWCDELLHPSTEPVGGNTEAT